MLCVTQYMKIRGFKTVSVWHRNTYRVCGIKLHVFVLNLALSNVATEYFIFIISIHARIKPVIVDVFYVRTLTIN